MKKCKILILLLVIFLLTGCGEITAVEEAIAAIGKVSLESFQSIDAVLMQVDELSEKQKTKVENIEVLYEAEKEYERLENAVMRANKAITAIGEVTYTSGDAIKAAQEAYDALKADNLTSYCSHYEVLVSAQNQYNGLVKAVERAESAIAEIGQVTLSSKSAIDAARKAYDALIPKGLTDYVQISYEVLVAAEEEYLKLYTTDLYQTAMQQYEEKRYSDAEKKFADLLKNYPKSEYRDDAIQMAIACKLAMVKQYRDANDLENAWYMIQSCASTYQSSKNNSDYIAMLSRIEADLEAARPKNGKVLTNKGVTGGYSQFIVEAGSTDALVKLESVDNPEKYVLFYVRAGESAKVSVKEGRYIAKYVVGPIWFNSTDMFGRDSQYEKADKIIEFDVEYKGSYVYYSETTMTLYSVQGGNLSTSDIPASSF